jgi:hypothetical protein
MKFLTVVSTTNHLPLAKEIQSAHPESQTVDIRDLNDPHRYHNFPDVRLGQALLRPPRVFKKPIWGVNRQNYLVSVWHMLRWVRPWVREVVRTTTPDLCVLQSDSGMVERLFIHECEQLGVRTVFLQDGLFVTCAPNLAMLGPLEGLGLRLRLYSREAARRTLGALGFPFLASVQYGHGSPHYAGYWSAYQGDVIRETLFPPQTRLTVVTGHTRITEQTRPRRLDLDPAAAGKLKVCYFGAGELGDLDLIEAEQIRWLVDTLRHDSAVHLFIKPHPQTGPSRYHALIDGCSHVSVISDKSLWSADVLVSTDLCITTISSVYHEAVLLGVPVTICTLGFARSLNRIYLPTHPGLVYLNSRSDMRHFFRYLDASKLAAIHDYQRQLYPETTSTPIAGEAQTPDARGGSRILTTLEELACLQHD